MYWNRSMEKVCNKRIESILSDPILLKLYNKFGMPYFRRSSVFHGLDRFLRKNGVTGKLCLEFGTWNGLTAVVLSRFFKQVVTVDIVDNREKYEVLEYLNIRNVTCITIASNEEKQKVIRQHPSFDFAYLDGNHEDDATTDWDLVKHCGRVLFQEVYPFQKPVFELVQSLPQEQVIYSDDGLAIWDKNRKAKKGD